MDATAQGVETTYELERDGLRSRMQLHWEQRRRTRWRWSGSGMGWGWGEITDASAQGAETTYFLEAERKQDGVRSRMHLHREQR